MTPEINGLVRSLHEKYLASLNLYRFIAQQTFQQAYAAASPDEAKVARSFIDTLDGEALIVWTRQILIGRKIYELLDIRCLRELARDRSIKNYSVMNRLELISQLTHRERNETSDNRTEGRNTAAADRLCKGQTREI